MCYSFNVAVIIFYKGVYLGLFSAESGKVFEGNDNGVEDSGDLIVLIDESQCVGDVVVA